MIHPAYRRLDEPPKIAGFSFPQWGGLILLAAAVYGGEHLLRLPTQPSITIFAFAVGLPAALAFFSEGGRPSLVRLLRDGGRWLLTPRRCTAGPGSPKPFHLTAADDETADLHVLEDPGVPDVDAPRRPRRLAGRRIREVQA